jgi:hypothetical protein
VAIITKFPPDFLADLVNTAAIHSYRWRMLKSKTLTSRVNLVVRREIVATIYSTQQLKTVTLKGRGAHYCLFVLVHLAIQLRPSLWTPVQRPRFATCIWPPTAAWHPAHHPGKSKYQIISAAGR